jgi:RNA polymerase sigma factor for flagellar operon FliA
LAPIKQSPRRRRPYLSRLVECYDRFDPSRGLKFATFYTHRVHGAIYDYIRGKDFAKRGLRRDQLKISTATVELTGRHGRLPTEEEICKATGFTLAALHKTQAGVDSCIHLSLDAPLTDDDKRDLEDALVGRSEDDPLAVFLAQEKVDVLNAKVAELTPRQQEVIHLVVDLEMTREQAAAVIGVVPSRVSQIIQDVTKTLRSEMMALGYKEAA